ncbi:heparin-sulfate lyase HepC [Niabella beijingensis]|uniref:heparin-sulfate lyase HepC n=1 Tax=Niabella beijingensis TaxID=2872700 RepID=UPI001CBD87A1|nr:heparin-sulfate lyase HepC [Niabella beijingensis]MBZ4192588.1 heparinase II/III family protein [Niabella beijingensis]
MNKIIAIVCLLILAAQYPAAQEMPISRESFEKINLGFPGLEKVNARVNEGEYREAAAALLDYYRSRTGVRHLDFNAADAKQFAGRKVDSNTLYLANNVLLHRFKPHKGYPMFDYGRDINWQYRPVQDQLLTTFLHRTAFWEPLGLVYRATGDEKYAKEWVSQVRDWIRKNRQGAYPDDQEYAWKAFVVSFRLNHWSGFFNLFLHSSHFTPAFLMEFLNSYNEQADYVMHHYTDKGNHRLYEALHLMYAGSTFPELKAASGWRKSGIGVLNAEIVKQVLPDGMQFELSPGYHIGTIKIFLDALQIAQLGGVAQEFPEQYRSLVEKMVLAVGKYSFPDYTYPLYGNAFQTTKKAMLDNYRTWAAVFPKNRVIEYYATDGASGTRPDYLSSVLPDAGFYAFRSGWGRNATVMQIKAGPPAAFHSHPDNGNFVLWVKGRDFTPDAGSFVYANVGNQENAKRDWYRSTRAHQTLTLDDKTIINKASLKKWEPCAEPEILSYVNPGYGELNHQRTFLFIDRTCFIIIDKAFGRATGKLGIHFNFKEDSQPVLDHKTHRAYTTYSDGNNLLIQNFNRDKVDMKEEQSFVSYEYQKEEPRPAFAFEKQKADTTAQIFMTVLYPYSGSVVPVITVKEQAGNDLMNGKIDLTLIVDGVSKKITASF